MCTAGKEQLVKSLDGCSVDTPTLLEAAGLHLEKLDLGVRHLPQSLLRVELVLHGLLRLDMCFGSRLLSCLCLQSIAVSALARSAVRIKPSPAAQLISPEQAALAAGVRSPAAPGPQPPSWRPGLSPPLPGAPCPFPAWPAAPAQPQRAEQLFSTFDLPAWDALLQFGDTQSARRKAPIPESAPAEPLCQEPLPLPARCAAAFSTGAGGPRASPVPVSGGPAAVAGLLLGL